METKTPLPSVLYCIYIYVHNYTDFLPLELCIHSFLHYMCYFLSSITCVISFLRDLSNYIQQRMGGKAHAYMYMYLLQSLSVAVQRQCHLTDGFTVILYI